MRKLLVSGLGLLLVSCAIGFSTAGEPEWNPAALKAYRARTASPQPTVTLSVVRSGNDLTITSDPQPLPTGFVLQTAPSINGPWADQAGANTPITVPIGTEQAVFLRAAKP